TWDDLRAQGRMYDVPGGSAETERAAVASAKAELAASRPKHMTVSGAVHKTWLLLALCITASIFSWNIAFAPEPIIPFGVLILGGGLGGLIVGLVCSFAPRTAPVTAPIYAVLKGGFLGALSAWYAVTFATESGEAGAALKP